MSGWGFDFALLPGWAAAGCFVGGLEAVVDAVVVLAVVVAGAGVGAVLALSGCLTALGFAGKCFAAKTVLASGAM